MQDASTLISLLKRLSVFDLFLLSFVALPFVFQAWTEVLKAIGYTPDGIGYWLIVITLIYLLLVCLMIYNISRENKKELAKDQVITYLQSRGYEMMSYDTVREKLNKTYSDEFLNAVIETFPSELRRAKLKGSKPGIARLVDEIRENQEL